jgi:hypothetical protein
MFLKSYHHLHPLFEVESSFVHKIDEDGNLDIFKILVNTISLLTKELLIENFWYFRDIKWM